MPGARTREDERFFASGFGERWHNPFSTKRLVESIRRKRCIASGETPGKLVSNRYGRHVRGQCGSHSSDDSSGPVFTKPLLSSLTPTASSRHADDRIQRKCGWSSCPTGVAVSSIRLRTRNSRSVVLASARVQCRTSWILRTPSACRPCSVSTGPSFTSTSQRSSSCSGDIGQVYNAPKYPHCTDHFVQSWCSGESHRKQPERRT